MNKYYEDDAVVIYQGDCREVLPHLADMSFDSVITDPPYGVTKSGDMLGQISANYHAKGTHSRGFADHSPSAFRALIEPFGAEVSRLVRPGRSSIVFGGQRTIHQMATAMELSGLSIIDQIAFVGGPTFAKSKTTLVPTYEPALLVRNPGKPYQINPARNIRNLMEGRKGKRESAHPTAKPQSWMDYCVRLTTSEGEVVLDPFVGGGSTLVAAKLLGRRAVGIELSEEYCEIAAERVSQIA